MIPWRNRLDLYPKQREAISDPEEHAIVLASPKAGKTIACLQWLIEETERIGRPHRRFLWVAPTFGQSTIAFRRAYQEVLDLEQISIHKTDHTITMPNETVIFFGSADKPDNIYGEDYHSVVVDEATRASLEAWIAITSTTQHTAARFRLIGNNTRRANWAKKLAKRAEKGELPGWTYTQLHREDAIDAGVVSAEQDAMTQLLIPDDDYNILYRGLDSDDGTIRIDTFQLKEEPLPDVAMKVRAWDFSASESGDWTVGALIHANSDGFWIADIKRERLAPEDVVDFIRQTATVDGSDVEQVAEEEKGASGILFVETLRRELDAIPLAGPVYAAPVEQNKVVRAWPFATAVKRGRYRLGPGVSSSELLEELDEWPHSTFDDQVDAIAHAHNHVAPMMAGLVGSGWVPK
jgi:predicted phage terminase large subunit-like protein